MFNVKKKQQIIESIYPPYINFFFFFFYSPMTEGKGLDENETDVMMRFNVNTSWFGHLALCIVLRHHFEAVFRMESSTVAETHSERESRSTCVVCSYQTAGERTATYKRHLSLPLSCQWRDEQVCETLSEIRGDSSQLHVLCGTRLDPGLRRISGWSD